MNKGRRWQKTKDDVDVCWRVATGGDCEFGAECRFSHDIPAYLAAKPRDIYFNITDPLTDTPPFVKLTGSENNMEAAVDSAQDSVDFSTHCPNFEETGACRHGFKCRFLGGHVRKEDGKLSLIQDDSKRSNSLRSSTEINYLDGQTMKLLRTKKYPLPITAAYLKELEDAKDEENASSAKAKADATPKDPPTPASKEDTESAIIFKEPEQDMVEVPPPSPSLLPAPAKYSDVEAAAQADTPDVRPRFVEKKRLVWSNKTYLAPLTTVGNLPFRRLAVSLGADITCGEMGLANSFLSASKEEWSLIRRHPDEQMFGIQLAGNKPSLLTPAAEVIARECAGGIDFVDLNCGCPIDLVFKTGSGSALLDAPGKLGKILTGMNRALGEIPLTVKLRTGVREGRNTSHKLMPRIASEWNVAAMTLHGRTRQQRYAKLADWAYIRECVDAVRAREADEDLPRIPIFGGGDAFSAQGYWSCVEESGVDGIMVARGALIKPWIFTEIKERREWDISAVERLDLIRKYAEFGLTHFGSDTAGVNTTRRYLCEALSFQYRYIPIGLLEALPPRINDRAPMFRGRSELETLLASPDSRDWVKISEMFLGPAPESWTFTPKHKSNAVNDQDQG
ncbi:FMN-linked oxidoreductase [Stereum hirsutum FP-91666 SS1]|uniref:FMN-linked oxidoreductase n=1 Tax=Stereum hirsutum (strain FP-91666) TaxID=721885 RepID=UPI000440BB85|nr:FMN-linked oxidoreductase [Stereum hirsutum FP-91666 SS1]EIM87584.1 FMN-linked oxidoreductase [Stereum hirsutum FP-91666 SS1]